MVRKLNVFSLILWNSGKVSKYKQLLGGVEFIDEIPKSPSGKILRRILKDMQAKLWYHSAIGYKIVISEEEDKCYFFAWTRKIYSFELDQHLWQYWMSVKRMEKCVVWPLGSPLLPTSPVWRPLSFVFCLAVLLGSLISLSVEKYLFS